MERIIEIERKKSMDQSAASGSERKIDVDGRKLLKGFAAEEQKKVLKGIVPGTMGRCDDGKVNILEKCLTASDVGKLNLLSITVNDAEKYSLFPYILGGSNILIFEDEDGKPWNIRCSYIRQSYVFTKGWSRYVKEKQLGAGDFVFFKRHRTDNSRLFIGYRRREGGVAALGQRDHVLPDPTSLVESSIQGHSAPKDWDYGLPDPTPQATFFVNFNAAPGKSVIPDPISPFTPIETLERIEKLNDVKTPLQLRLPEHSVKGFDPILFISCGDNQDSEETYFISYIFNELCLRGFAPLRYDLTRSVVTGNQELLYRSRVGIMIFSKNYARSSECLDKFVTIMDLLKANDLPLIPVFFKVNHWDLFTQTGPFGKAFSRLGNLVVASQFLKWKAALTELTSFNRYQYMKGEEVTLAKNIVRDVCSLLNSKTRKNLTLIKLPLENILSLLHSSQSSSDAPQIVGLWGIAGMGKTTIAREVFRTQAEKYDVCYFLPDFHVMCETKGLNHLRDEFFSKIFGEEKVFIDACDTKLSFTRDWFLDKRVLIVLDDVSNARDVEILVGGFGWFSGRHTIILTSRNRQVLVQCKAKKIYQIPELSEYESFRLCCQYGTEENWKGRMPLISELVDYASGIPLALRVLASYVQKQYNNEKQHLRRLRLHPPIEIQDAFRRSFNGLDDNEKNTFLDSLPDELRLLHWERYPLASLPRNFIPKNLVELNMPYSNLRKLWKGTKNLEKLKRIILSHSRELTKFPRFSKALNLEYIDLEGCTSLVKVNSSILHHRKLTFLSLKDCSRLRVMPTTVHLESLEVLDLSGCSELEDIQGFSANLTELYLAGTAIREMPSSIGNLTRLVTLDLKNCDKLQQVPPEIYNLKAVVTLSTKRHASSVETKDLSSVISSVTNISEVSDPSYKSSTGSNVSPKRTSQLECQFYMKGYCRFGDDCRFGHTTNRETPVPESSLRSILRSIEVSSSVGASSKSELVQASTKKPRIDKLGFSLSLGNSSSELVQASTASEITQATVGRDTIDSLEIDDFVRYEEMHPPILFTYGRKKRTLG